MWGRKILGSFLFYKYPNVYVYLPKNQIVLVFWIYHIAIWSLELPFRLLEAINASGPIIETINSTTSASSLITEDTTLAVVIKATIPTVQPSDLQHQWLRYLGHQFWWLLEK